MIPNISIDFIRFALNEKALRFGFFTTKSGRNSPYFFNIGLFSNGISIMNLANFYAQALLNSGIQFDMLFGPAYKGIPLVTATAIALANFQDKSTDRKIANFSFNRKEEKTHGEQGKVIGYPPKGKVVIIDDVITSGSSISESINLIRSYGAHPVAVLVAIDRMERYKKANGILSENSAAEEIHKVHCVPVLSIASMLHILQVMQENVEFLTCRQEMIGYLSKYGVNYPGMPWLL